MATLWQHSDNVVATLCQRPDNVLATLFKHKKLSQKFKILYTGKNGNVAHECIIDIRPIKEKVGISEEDIAKRLIDYGLHEHTMSWPVAGTIMIEPTESENLEEINKFCDAMLRIKDEIDKVDKGKFNGSLELLIKKSLSSLMSCNI